jgi:riboflavin-specific deaminase-like protein
MKSPKTNNRRPVDSSGPVRLTQPSRQAGQARRKARSFVAATFAMTVDGKITTRAFSPVDFTSREDKRHLLRQRSLGDAVLIGRSTLAHDNVRLGLPDPAMRAEREGRGQAPYPLRVIVSSAGRIDPALKIFQTDFSPIVIFSTIRMPRKYQLALREKATLRLSDSGAVDLRRMLETLRSEYGVRRVACEGGAELFRSLLALKLVDQLNLTIAPYVFGGKSAPTLTGRSDGFFSSSVRASIVEQRVIAEECFLVYRLKY